MKIYTFYHARILCALVI